MKQVSIREYEQREDGSVSTRPLFVDQFVGPELGEPFIAFLGSLAVCPSFDKEYGFRIFLHVTTLTESFCNFAIRIREMLYQLPLLK